MVEKPQKGKCAKCGSENIKFYDDGFGRCMDCGRTFQWMEEDQSQPQQSQQKQQTQQQPQQTSQTTGQQSSESTQQPKKSTETIQQRATPKQPKSRPSKKKSKTKAKSSKKSVLSKGFLYIATVGFVLMIIGYILRSLTMMGLDIQTDTVKLLIGLFSLFSYTGILLVGFGLVYGAVTADTLDEKIRAWMLIAMALLLGLFLSFNAIFSSITSIGGI